MRRNVGLVLLVVGALFLVLAPLLRWYAYPRLAVAPQDQASTTVSTGTDVTVFSIPALLAGEDPEVDLPAVEHLDLDPMGAGLLRGVRHAPGAPDTRHCPKDRPTAAN